MSAARGPARERREAMKEVLDFAVGARRCQTWRFWVRVLHHRVISNEIISLFAAFLPVIVLLLPFFAANFKFPP